MRHRHDIMQRLEFLAEREAGQFSRMAKASFRNGSLSLDRLEHQLSHFGFETQYEEAKHGWWCRVFYGTDLKAKAYSQTKDDALSFAVWGAVREEHAMLHVSEQLKLRGLKATDEQKQKMCSRYIIAGDAALTADLLVHKG